MVAGGLHRVRLRTLYFILWSMLLFTQYHYIFLIYLMNILRTYHVVLSRIGMLAHQDMCGEIPFLKIRHCLKEVFYVKIKLCPYLASLAPFEKSSGNIYSYPLLSTKDWCKIWGCYNPVCKTPTVQWFLCNCWFYIPVYVKGLIVLESHIWNLYFT